MPSPVGPFLDRHRLRTIHDLGLFFLRVAMALLLLFGHGWPKLMQFGERSASFADPLGIGSIASLILTLFSEVGCSVFVALGLFTRYAVIPLIIMFTVILLFVHDDDPFTKQELALMYLIPFITLLLTGPGRFSLDRKLRKTETWWSWDR